MQNKRWKKEQLLLGLEAFVLVFMFILIQYRNHWTIETSIADWRSNYIKYDNGWHVDESMIQTDDTIDLIFGPYIKMGRGDYSIRIDYSCDYDQTCLVYAASGDSANVKAGMERLRKGQKSISFDFSLKKEIKDFEVIVKYNGKGALTIKDIQIVADSSGLLKTAVMIFYLFLTLDISVYLYRRLKKWQMLFFLETAVLIFLAVAMFLHYIWKDTIDTALADWESEYVGYHDGWYIDEEILEKDSDSGSAMRDNNGLLDLIHGPYIALRRGTYSVKIDYECDEDQNCFAYADYVYSVYIKSGINKLRKNQKNAVFTFTLTEDINNFEVVVQYNGKGSLQINNIEIQSENIAFQRIFVVVVALFFMSGICFSFKKYILKNKNFLLVIGGMIMLVSLPLFVRGVNSGHDIMVHLMRIEGLAEEIRRGKFPVRMSALWMDGYGYPVSIYYGDFLLYIAAILRIIGFPVITAYKFYVFLINIGTVIISCLCFRRIFEKREIAVLVTLAYVTAGYRIVCIYARAAVGEYSAMMFFPLIALSLYQFYTMESQGWELYRRYALILAVGMAGVIGTHILSTEMAVVVIALVCVGLWKRTFRKNVLKGYILAVIETLALSAYFLIPFLDYYLNVDVSVSYAANDIKIVQDQGAYIGQYFAFFQKMFGMSQIDLPERMSVTPGLVLMAVLVFAIVGLVNKKTTQEMNFFTIFSLVLLFVASNLFPWNYLGLHYGWGKILSHVQFPWRYIGIAVLFLVMLLGSICKHFRLDTGAKRKYYVLIAGSCVMMSIFYVSDYCNNASMIYYYDTAELDTYAVGGGEYVRSWTNLEDFTGELFQENMKEVSLLSREGTCMEVYCRAAGKDGIVEIPILNYKGYRVKDEYGKEYPITDGTNHVIRFSVPSGFSGKIRIDFVEPWYWRIGTCISLISVIYFSIRGIMLLRNKNIRTIPVMRLIMKF